MNSKSLSLLLFLSATRWLAVCAKESQPPATANFLPNPSFELTEPSPPSAETAKKGSAPAETWLPRTWNVWAENGAVYRLPDDPAQAHSGRRCVYFQAQKGRGQVRYWPIPAPQGKHWTSRFWAKGHGRIMASTYDISTDPWKPIQHWPFDLKADWSPFEFEFELDSNIQKWMLNFATEGDTELWLDDLSLTFPGLVSLPLPPEGPLSKDEHTLLYLPFEEPLNEDAFFVKGKVSLSKAGEGRFGKALVFGPEGYIACSANENLDPSQGTIEVWVKLLSPGNDSTYRPLVQVPGPEGMSFRKDQYSHVGFGFSSGWRTLSHATAMGYAHQWQPGVWRHFAACWDKDLMEVFVDGKLIAWTLQPKLSRALGPELGIGCPGLLLDDLRISNVVRYCQPVPAP